MKILFDARWINNDSPDGITRYSTELIKAIIPNKNLTLLVCQKEQIKGLPKLDFILTNRPTSPKEIKQAISLNDYNFDIVYTPHYLFGGKGRKFKLVRTVHDLIPFRHKDSQSKLIWKIFHSNKSFFKKLLNDSEGLVTVSKVVAKELTELANKEIQVLYNAPSKFNKKASHKTEKNLFYIGRYEKYKNIEQVIRAINALPEYKLFLAGSCSETRKNQLLSIARDSKQLKFLGKISDSDYEQYLINSRALVMPSKDEGFGLPIVEAMSVGCPVICSDIEVFREIASSAGIFFELNNTDSLVDAIISLDNENFRKDKIERSFINARRFSWHKSAKDLVTFLNTISYEK